MASVVPMKTRSLREKVSADEWSTRVDLAACYRLVALYGMTDLVYNHITARVPGSNDHVLINPYGMLYDEITASSLIKIDLEGNTVLQPDHNYSVNAAGYVIHSAIHGARHDAHCVIHTHTRAGTAVSALAEGLMPLSQTAMRFAGQVAYHEYEGPAFNRGERERLIADLGGRNALILRNHGLLVCGPSIPQAFNLIYWLEQACKIQIDILSCGRPLHVPAQDVVEGTAEALSGTEITLDNEDATNPHVTAGAQKGQTGYGLLEWPALRRRLDRLDPSYAD
ncbi:MAG TPA: class II aldolase/adducin family protein [Hyphomicrobiaceae bacterium]|jgi:ribulose-5-phosphate 4-epimerase/fuculose-1-phosphate aldolase|nr:class II aldolase/adducin family protein [Hyphomicrobiaceae bacterium]